MVATSLQNKANTIWQKMLEFINAGVSSTQNSFFILAGS